MTLISTFASAAPATTGPSALQRTLDTLTWLLARFRAAKPARRDFFNPRAHQEMLRHEQTKANALLMIPHGF